MSPQFGMHEKWELNKRGHTTSYRHAETTMRRTSSDIIVAVNGLRATWQQSQQSGRPDTCFLRSVMMDIKRTNPKTWSPHPVWFCLLPSVNLKAVPHPVHTGGAEEMNYWHSTFDQYVGRWILALMKPIWHVKSLSNSSPELFWIVPFGCLLLYFDGLVFVSAPLALLGNHDCFSFIRLFFFFSVQFFFFFHGLCIDFNFFFFFFLRTFLYLFC